MKYYFIKFKKHSLQIGKETIEKQEMGRTKKSILSREQSRRDEEVSSFEFEKKSGAEHWRDQSCQSEDDRREVLKSQFLE